MSQHVNVASRACTYGYFPKINPRGESSASHREPDGPGIVAMPWLRRLGLAVAAVGRLTDDDEPTRRFLQKEGISWVTSNAVFQRRNSGSARWPDENVNGRGHLSCAWDAIRRSSD